MGSPQPDTAFTLANQLLGHMMDRLKDAANPPAKSFVCDSTAVPADDCCNGIAWVRVVNIVPTNGDGEPYRTMANAPTPVPGHSIFLEFGVMRCTPILDEQGNAPDPAEYTAAALQAAADRQQMRLALLCDLPADIIAINADGQIPGNWTPLDAGGCGGGYMTTEIGTSVVF